jgi:hypothetical protein
MVPLFSPRCDRISSSWVIDGLVAVGAVDGAWESHAANLGVVALSGGVPGWVGRYAACFGAAEVSVALVGEEDVAPTSELELVGWLCWMPAVAGEFVILEDAFALNSAEAVL